LFHIVYPSGSHGSFLKLLLNKLSGVQTDNTIDYRIYDKIKYLSPVFFDAGHDVTTTPTISIHIRPSSYLKYFAMCLTRTADVNILVNNLGNNVFKKLEQHPILKSFTSSLSRISGQINGDVESKYIREWLRLCFFANNGTTITQFVSPSMVEADYTVDFESFYNGSILEHCYQIYKMLGLKIIDIKVAENLIEQFPEKLIYHNIDLNIDQILAAIDNGTKFDLSDTNLLQQAWIDNCLVNRYNIDPLLKNDYFSNTQELRKAYNLS
jgi:hypothetical protein